MLGHSCVCACVFVRLFEYVCVCQSACVSECLILIRQTASSERGPFIAARNIFSHKSVGNIGGQSASRFWAVLGAVPFQFRGIMLGGNQFAHIAHCPTPAIRHSQMVVPKQNKNENGLIAFEQKRNHNTHTHTIAAHCYRTRPI